MALISVFAARVVIEDWIICSTCRPLSRKSSKKDASGFSGLFTNGVGEGEDGAKSDSPFGWSMLSVGLSKMGVEECSELLDGGNKQPISVS
jgi:hypothetical protein